MRRSPRCALALPLLLAVPPLAGCGSGGPAVAAPAQRSMTALARLGEAVFHDPTLSASGRMSCATCHDEAHAFAPPNALAVQRGGPRGDQPRP